MFLAKKAKTKKNEGRKNHSTSDNCYILTETKTQNIFKQIEAIEPEIVIIDSIQTLHTDYIESTAGSISQIRETTAELIKSPKKPISPLFLLAILPKTET
jgi:DNA repair protein RadA/Sms